MEELLKQLITEVKEINTRLDKMDTHLDKNVNNRLEKLGSQTSENTQIFRALEHKADVNKVEHDNFTHQLAELSKDVKSGFKEVNHIIDRISSDLLTVQAVTGKNMQDIAYLKAIR